MAGRTAGSWPVCLALLLVSALLVQASCSHATLASSSTSTETTTGNVRRTSGSAVAGALDASSPAIGMIGNEEWKLQFVGGPPDFATAVSKASERNPIYLTTFVDAANETKLSVSIRQGTPNRVSTTYTGKWSADGVAYTVTGVSPVIRSRRAGPPAEMDAEEKLAEMLADVAEIVAYEGVSLSLVGSGNRKQLLLTPASPTDTTTAAPPAISSAAKTPAVGTTDANATPRKLADATSTTSSTTAITTSSTSSTTATTTTTTTTSSTTTTTTTGPLKTYHYEMVDFTYTRSWESGIGETEGFSVATPSSSSTSSPKPRSSGNVTIAGQESSDYDFAEYDLPTDTSAGDVATGAASTAALSEQVFDESAKQNATGQWLLDWLHPHRRHWCRHHHHHRRCEADDDSYSRRCMYGGVRFPVPAVVSVRDSGSARVPLVYHVEIQARHRIVLDVAMLNSSTLLPPSDEARVQSISIEGPAGPDYKRGVERRVLEIIRSLTWFVQGREFFTMGTYGGYRVTFAAVRHLELDMRSYQRDGQTLPLFDPEVHGCEELRKNLLVTGTLTPLTYRKLSHYRRYMLKVNVINTHLFILEVNSLTRRAMVLRYASTNFDKFLSGGDYVEREIVNVLSNMNHVDFRGGATEDFPIGITFYSGRYGSLTLQDARDYIENPWLSAVRCVNIEQPAYLSLGVVPADTTDSCWFHPAGHGCRYTAPLSCSHSGLLDVVALLRVYDTYSFQIMQVVGHPALVDWQTVRHSASISPAEHLAEWDFYNRMRHSHSISVDRQLGSLTFCGLLSSIRFQANFQKLRGLAVSPSEVLVLDAKNAVIDGAAVTLDTPVKPLQLSTRMEEIVAGLAEDNTSTTTTTTASASTKGVTTTASSSTDAVTTASSTSGGVLPPPIREDEVEDYSALMPPTRGVEATLTGVDTYNFKMVTPALEPDGGSPAEKRTENVRVELISQARTSGTGTGSGNTENTKQVDTETRVAKALAQTTQASRMPDGSLVFGDDSKGIKLTFRQPSASLAVVAPLT